jgi:hypothetical protein
MIDIVLCSEKDDSPVRFENLKLVAGVESNIQYRKVNIGNARGGLQIQERKEVEEKVSIYPEERR